MEEKIVEYKDIPGVDSIVELSNPQGYPAEVEIDFEMVKLGQSLMQVWNAKLLAFLPYCFICRVPLDWRIQDGGASPTSRGSVAFICPKCNRVWKYADK